MFPVASWRQDLECSTCNTTPGETGQLAKLTTLYYTLPSTLMVVLGRFKEQRGNEFKNRFGRG